MSELIAASAWWVAKESHTNIQILPSGEETMHVETILCECQPMAEKDYRDKLIVIHNAFDGRHEFEKYDQSTSYLNRQKRDA